MAVKTRYLPRYTYREYEQWEGRWELIRGIPHAMSPQPSIRHQEISGVIHRQLAEALEGCPACQPLLPVDWRLDEETVLQPDNLVVCAEVSGQYLTVPPVLIFEVLSPSTAYKDRVIKAELYAGQGVRHYVLVDPEAAVAEVFQRQGDHYQKRLDAQYDVVDFDLGACRIGFDFSRLWEAR